MPAAAAHAAGGGPAPLLSLRGFRGQCALRTALQRRPVRPRRATLALGGLRLGGAALCSSGGGGGGGSGGGLDARPGGGHQPAAPPPPADGAIRWLRNAGAGALLGAVALFAAARPAGAAPPPPGAAPPAAASAAAGAAPPGWRATGLLLADASAGTRRATPEELDAETRAALNRTGDERLQKALKRASAPSKGGKLVRDPSASVVADPASVPGPDEIKAAGLQTAWRPDKLREMTYTQFWALVRERQVERARYSDDRRSVYVTTRPTAPGGARTEKVGLPYDPDLFDHLVEHGVYVETPDPNPALPVLHAVARLVFPIWFSFLLVKFAFRLGRRKKRDKIFGGAQLDVVRARDAAITFADIAGIDQVKAEIMEIVAFLRAPARFLALGARSPAGVLLVGPPGTGKTLLAKAIAGEAGVPFFSIAGTEFMEMFVGVGASRVRDMFQQARAAAPCILFIDEFDGLGKARTYGGAGNDESVHTINQLLTEMDGFEDNTGVVVMAATNRPAALDAALTRPGRFDRIVHLPLPNLEGRAGILRVHARGKRVDPGLDYSKVARATAGFTGAELMNLMNQAAILTARQGQPAIAEAEVFEALEKIHRDRLTGGAAVVNFEQDVVPPGMRRTIAVYEAGRALVGWATPGYDEVQRVSCCPGGLATGYTYFLPREERLESRVVTRGHMESRLVVALAGRAAEALVLGEAAVSTAGAADLELANSVAREMVYRCGFGRRTGPVALMDNEEVYLNRGRSRRVADVSTELARVAYADVAELLGAAEAKAYYCLASNYGALGALAAKLEATESLPGDELTALLEGAGAQRLGSPYVEGYGWDDAGALDWPGRPERLRQLMGAGAEGGNGAAEGGNGAVPAWWSPRNPYSVRTDIADMLADN